ncbi:MAG TPA: hypothetical protein VF277_08350 [Steroidobacteraceae bacterium]
MTTKLPARSASVALRAGFTFVTLVAYCVLAGCGERTTPEQQVRAVIAAGEAAAEQRSLSALMALVSPRYEDGQGGSAVELSRTLRGYLLLNQSVHLLVRVESIQFRYRDLAQVRLTVGTLGRKATAADTLAVAADVIDVQLELQLERGEWKVTRAAWHPVAGA